VPTVPYTHQFVDFQDKCFLLLGTEGCLEEMGAAAHLPTDTLPINVWLNRGNHNMDIRIDAPNRSRNSYPAQVIEQTRFIRHNHVDDAKRITAPRAMCRFEELKKLEGAVLAVGHETRPARLATTQNVELLPAIFVEEAEEIGQSIFVLVVIVHDQNYVAHACGGGVGKITACRARRQ